MLVLCSDGLSGRTLCEALRLRLDGCRSAALVVTADSVYKERNYHVPRCVAELESLGLTVTLFDIDAQTPEGLLAFDVVEFIGGNPFYLLDVIRRTNAAPVLWQLAEKKVLIGWSAAAFVFGPTLALVNRYSPEMNTIGLADLTGLALTQTEVLPHYSRFLQRFDRFEETCCAYEREHGVQVIRLNDGDGVLLDGGRVILCRN